MEQFFMKTAAAVFMLLFFGFCIFIHELGHFLAAKWRGLHIIAFSIGFRKVWWKKINGVEYRIGCIPVGGYVDLPQIDASGDAKDENGNILPKAKPLDRMIVAFAGPLFNILFGLFLGVFIWIGGIQQDSPSMTEFAVESVMPKSPEYRAGLRDGDVIYKINGEHFDTTWNGLFNKILFTIGDVRLSVKRGNQELEIHYKPEVNRSVNPEEEIPYPFFKPVIPVRLYPVSGSPAALAGVKNGDQVIAVNGKKTSNLEEFLAKVSLADGEPLKLTILRGKETVFLTVPTSVETDEDGKDGTWLLGFTGNPLLSVMEDSPIAKAGLKRGDRIIEVNGRKVESVPEIRRIVNSVSGKSMKLVYVRDGKELTTTLSPKYYRNTHLAMHYAPLKHTDPVTQFNNVMKLTWNSLRGIGYSVGRKVGLTQQYTPIKAKHMSGPIGIGRYLFVSFLHGSITFALSVVVVITFNLGLVNLLPIPILDGGHIVFGLLELIFRRPVPRKVLEPVSIAFISLLIAFMIFVSFYDVKKIVMPVVHSIQTEKTMNAEKVQNEKTLEQKH